MPRNVKRTTNKNKKNNIILIEDTLDKNIIKNIKGPAAETEDELYEMNRLDKKEFNENEESVDDPVENDYDDELGDDVNEIDDEDKNISPDSDKDNDEEEETVDVEFEEKKETRDDDYAYDDDKCFYNYADDEKSEGEEVELIFDDDAIEQTPDIVSLEQRITKPFLTKYERVRILGDRTQQLTLGAKPMIKNVETLTPRQIAVLELKNNIMPLIIVRPLPNGKREKWYLRELKH